MLFQLDIYHSLTVCAISCDEFASRCARCQDEHCRELVMLGLDCADLCRQVALVYRRNLMNAQELVRTCMLMCRRLIDGARHIDGQLASHVADVCEQVQRNCALLLQGAGQHPDSIGAVPAVCYGVVMNNADPLYRGSAYPAA